MLELTDYRLYENVAKLLAELDAMKEYVRLLEQRIEKLEDRINEDSCNYRLL